LPWPMKTTVLLQNMVGLFECRDGLVNTCRRPLKYPLKP
jgi:hypothetical protein